MKQTSQFFAARDRFHREVAARGGIVLGDYAGSKVAVHVRCAAGHDCHPLPSNLTKQDRGMCQSCAGRSRDDAEARFIAAAEAEGWTVRGAYAGAHTPVAMTCPGGHEVSPTPGNFRARKRCAVCARCLLGAAESDFLNALAAEGSRAVGVYVNARTPVTCECANGHVTDRTPYVVTGNGARCRLCEHRHDAFYVVSGPAGVKFGISHTGGLAARLAVHRRDGYATVHETWDRLPGDIAYSAETEVKRLLALAGVAPVRGREYFPLPTLDTVLYMARGLVEQYEAAA